MVDALLTTQGLVVANQAGLGKCRFLSPLRWGTRRQSPCQCKLVVLGTVCECLTSPKFLHKHKQLVVDIDGEDCDTTRTCACSNIYYALDRSIFISELPMLNYANRRIPGCRRSTAL